MTDRKTTTDGTDEPQAPPTLGDIERDPHLVPEQSGTIDDPIVPPSPVDPVAESVLSEDWGRMPEEDEDTIHGSVTGSASTGV